MANDDGTTLEERVRNLQRQFNLKQVDKVSKIVDLLVKQAELEDELLEVKKELTAARLQREQEETSLARKIYNERVAEKVTQPCPPNETEATRVAFGIGFTDGRA